MSEHVLVGVVMTVFGTVFAGLGLLVLVTGVSNLRSYVAMKASDPIPVREVSDADVPLEFEGRVRRKDDGNGGIRAPFSGEDCVACSYCIREKTETKPGANKDRFSMKETGEVADDFVVVGDDGAEVEVDPSEAAFELGDEEPVLEVGSDESLPDDVEERVHEVIKDADDLSLEGSWTHRYEESHLKRGDTAHVYGGEVVDGDDGRGIEHTRVAASEDGLYHITAGDEGAAVGKKLKKGVVLLIFGGFFGIAGAGAVSAGISNLV